MNVSTGVYRLAQVVKWAGRLVAAGVAVIWVAHPPAAGDMGFIAALGLIPWGVTAAIAWVLEGFAKN